jgi:hypothetical protein
MKLLRFALVFLLVVPSVLSGQQPTRVSMLDLIESPDKYDGAVKGFLKLEFEGDALYFHKEDFMQALSENAVWIDAPKISEDKRKTVSDKYVIVVGRFDARDRGHMGAFRGTINSITRLDLWPSQQDFARMTRQSPTR